VTKEKNENPAGEQFEDWILSWKDEIDQATAYCKSPLPTDASQIQPDLNRTTRELPRMIELLADAEKHLADCRLQETLYVKGDPRFNDFNAEEKKTVVASRISHITRVRDILAGACKALKDRGYYLMNLRNWERENLRLAAHAEG
jgi:hypothetical protein